MEGNIFDWLYENREAVLKAYAETGESPKQTWDRLTGTFPELDGLTKFNSFKTYLKPAVEMLNRVEPERDSGTGEEFSKVKQSLEEANAENERLQSMVGTLTGELNKVKQEAANMETENERLNNAVKQTESDVPANVEGWTVAFTGGYYKLFKKVGGKVKGVHLGKVFDRDKAVEKIKAKEAELGIR